MSSVKNVRKLQELLIFDSLSAHVAFRDMCAAILADDIICIQEKNNQELFASASCTANWLNSR